MDNADLPLQISTDLARLDVPMIYRFLSEDSTWAVGIGRDVVERAIDNSLCFGAYLDGRQVAFARVISDYATFANLVDVFVLPAYRGHGYSKQLIQAVMDHPSLQGLRRFTLATFTYDENAADRQTFFYLERDSKGNIGYREDWTLERTH